MYEASMPGPSDQTDGFPCWHGVESGKVPPVSWFVPGVARPGTNVCAYQPSALFGSIAHCRVRMPVCVANLRGTGIGISARSSCQALLTARDSRYLVSKR